MSNPSEAELRRIIQEQAAVGMGRLNTRLLQLESEEKVKNNLSGTAAPTATDDLGEGYSAGSFWFDTTNDIAYLCLDATAGAAIWKRINTGGDGARVYNDADLTISTSSSTELTFNSERYDDNDYHSTVSNTGRLVAPEAGRYSAGVNVAWASNSTGYRMLIIQLNGSTIIGQESRNAVSGQITYQSLTGIEYDLAEDDYLTVLAFQNSGGNLNISSLANRSPEFWISRIR